MINFKLFPTDYCPICQSKLIAWINPANTDYVIYHCPTKTEYITVYNWGHYAFDLKQLGVLFQFFQFSLECLYDKYRIFSTQNIGQYPLIQDLAHGLNDDLNIDFDNLSNLEKRIETWINFS